LAVALTAGFVFSGCGTPGAPSPPSLNLPDTVSNLSASRTGGQVTLTWTMPKKNTDKLLIEGNIAVYVCRQEVQSPCVASGKLDLAPGAESSFTDTLPAAEAAGEPRALSYFVELKNRRGRSAGVSNAAVVLAGAAPAPVSGLTAKVMKAGVTLRWTPTQEREASAIRLHRKLLTPPTTKPAQGPLTPQPEPLEQSLLVAAEGRAPDRALDKDIRFGQAYEYRAQRVARISVGGQTLELAGPLSAPIRVEAKDVFPPGVPTGLAAVATAANDTAKASIDLSWQPGTDTDLVGYIVYRREGEGDWKRISPAQPVAGPAFHDAEVEAGHTYSYAVTAIDQGGHESDRSAEAQEIVPNP
jgi:hypothetical protein